MNSPFFEVSGARVSRLEDYRLITGNGKYAADWNLPEQLHGHFLRSERAHARIVAVDITAAKMLPGVHAVLTGDDAVRAGYVQPVSFFTFAGKNGARPLLPQWPVLAHERVRFTGEPVAFVVAESAHLAQDACALIEIEYEDLPCVVDSVAALEPAAPLLHQHIPGNMPFECEAGDAAATAAAFAVASHVTRLRLTSARVVPSPLEPRACLVAFDAQSESYTVHACVQGANMLRMQLSGYTQVPEDKLKIVARDVGGGFGCRSMGYPEYCVAMMAARATGRPVKWISTRAEAFLADNHGRGSVINGELALDANGKFLAMRLDWIAEVGAYMTPPAAAATIRNPIVSFTGAYRIPALYGRWRVALTNAAPIGNYRGAGRPDIAYVVERLVSQAAAEVGIDAVELRRRNYIPMAAFPYTTPTGSVYENADFAGLMDKALAAADSGGYPVRMAASARAGKLRGRGIATVIETTNAGMYNRDQIALEVDRGGRVMVHTVSHAQGQGHETTLAMLVARALEIPAERVMVRQGLNAPPLFGNHTGGSRNTVGVGTICHLTALKLIEQGKGRVAEQLGVEPSQIHYAAGEFRCSEPAKIIALHALAGDAKFSIIGEGSFGATFPNDCHIAEVEIDADTGHTTIASYVTADDFGVVVNETIVEGQLHGAVLQGAGQVFGEQALYDPNSGQLLTGSFLDYYLPRAGLIRDINMNHHATASRVSPLGVKGMGEAGCTGALPALTNAVMDALRPLGIAHLDMPLTPAKIWSAIYRAKHNPQGDPKL
ncbi:MAG: xanthine dehydrogenase family protein molybdopterin-binding subunit [Betaproteobacteria bacterium]|nr:xanthine dehydrogenase family protein molybdopterin-binding subunit [Betaproteobacteria bacterium]